MKMRDKIGYPPYIMRAKALDKEYDGLQFNESSFLLNILKMRKFEVVKEIRKVQRRVDLDKDWYIQPLVANAFHNPTANEIVIPLGILRYPMFDENYPMYLNFANLGIVLGHEMTHGFDHQGRHYDKDGNFTSWWPDDVQISFRNQAICFAEQYGKFKMPLVDQFVDGNDTLADNVCDNAALRHSWLAYQMWAEDHNVEEPLLPGLNFTIPQIFYMTFGQIWCEVLNKEGYQQYVRDTHSPGQFRAWGVAQNNIYFGEIFDCPDGSPMNPTHKCSLWS
jgi:predicted metalloendopeptidase